MPDPITSALAAWAAKQLADRSLAGVRRRRLRENDSPVVRAALLEAVRLGTADALAEVFPEDVAQQDQVRLLLFERETDMLPLVDGTRLVDLPAVVAAWIAWIEASPDETPDPAAVGPGHHFAVELCSAILARVEREALRGDQVLGNLWLDFQLSKRATEDASAIERQVSNDFGPIDTVVQGQTFGQVNFFPIELTIEPASVREPEPASNRTNAWAAGPEDAGALDRSLAKHKRQARSLKPAIGLIDRPEIEEALAILRGVDSPQVVVVDGDAGAGKSAVVTALASSLAGQDWVVAFTRMDGSEPVRNAASVGAQMDLSGSPTVVLAGVAAGRKGLLVIDQLDAVSELSGRVPESFEAVDEILEEVRDYANIKVLLACRTVDLNRDPRLRSLVHGDNSVAKRVPLGLLDPDRIRTALSEYGHWRTFRKVDTLACELCGGGELYWV